MAVTEQLTIGPVHTLATNTVYALPPRACLITVDTTGGAIISVSLDNSTFIAVTLDANKNFQSSAPFIKSTTAPALLVARLI